MIILNLPTTVVLFFFFFFFYSPSVSLFRSCFCYCFPVLSSQVRQLEVEFAYFCRLYATRAQERRDIKQGLVKIQTVRREKLAEKENLETQLTGFKEFVPAAIATCENIQEATNCALQLNSTLQVRRRLCYVSRCVFARWWFGFTRLSGARPSGRRTRVCVRVCARVCLCLCLCLC